MIKRFISLVIASVMLLVIVFQGWGDSIKNVQINSTAKAQQKVNLSLWIENITPERNSFFEELVKNFEKENPNIHVDYLGIPGTANDAKMKLDIAFAAGEGPDIHDNFIAEYVARGYCENLTPYFGKWKDKSKIIKAALDANRVVDTKKHNLYALPEYANIFFMWMRSDWFKDAHLPLPENWDRFFDDVKKLTDKSKGIYGLSIRGGGGGAQNLLYMMHSYSGITQSFTKDGKSTINDPKHIEFVEKFLGLYKEYTPEDDLTKGWTELAATFQSGKAAVIYHNLGSGPANEQAFKGDYSKFQAVQYPKGVKGYRTHPNLMPCGFVMNKNSKHKKEAWQLMTYLVSAENNAKLAKIYGALPVNTDSNRFDYNQGKQYVKSAMGLLNDPNTHWADEPSWLPNYRTILSNTAEPLMQQTMVKQITAKQFLDQWANEMTKAKAKFDGENKK